MSSAALPYAAGQPRRPSTSRGGKSTSSTSSASSRAADAAIRDLKGIRRRRHSDGDGGDDSAFAALASHVSATVEAYGLPRWIIRALVLAGVGLVLAVAVFNTLPMLARHGVAGTATFNGKPLAGVTVGFQLLGDSATAEPRLIRTTADGSFQIAEAEGLPPGIYAVTVRPGESAKRIPSEYRSAGTTPLRFEIREDLTGMQVSVRDGSQPVRKNRR
ncbi:MAG: carboxypeptidase-like regulatory domain-containing protein [Planctomycetia bacterium]